MPLDVPGRHVRYTERIVAVEFSYKSLWKLDKHLKEARGGVPWGGKNMSICRKNKEGLVFIPSGLRPFGCKKLAPYCFIANTPVFSPLASFKCLSSFFFFGNSTDICVKIGQVWTNLARFSPKSDRVRRRVLPRCALSTTSYSLRRPTILWPKLTDDGWRMAPSLSRVVGVWWP
jgi:hypothetical protein